MDVATVVSNLADGSALSPKQTSLAKYPRLWHKSTHVKLDVAQGRHGVLFKTEVVGL